MAPEILRSESLEETRRVGHALAERMAPGTTVALAGPLGAGKTTLVRSIAEALGCQDAYVNSPTFVVIQEYAGRVPVYHVDAYRLKDSDEFLELGGDELLRGDGIALIEWADRIADVLPRDLVRIEIVPTGESSREFRVTGLPSP
jgi:tRNA threonylcarbamoyladenosine biosynthesis protein TsaE